MSLSVPHGQTSPQRRPTSPNQQIKTNVQDTETAELSTARKLVEPQTQGSAAV